MTRPILALILCLLFAACTPPPARVQGLPEVEAAIVPHLRVFKPEAAGAAPMPTVLAFHGASDHAWIGPRGNEQYLPTLSALVDAGFAVVFVDSYAGRGLSGQSLRAGSLLPAERASDVYAALAWARRQDWIAGERLGLLGFSHGGATIMDALVQASAGQAPVGLASAPAAPLAGAAAAVLYYPWCSGRILGIEVMKAADTGWDSRMPMLVFQAARDSQSDTGLCATILERQRQRGGPVEIVTYPGTLHGFDGIYGSPDDAGTAYNAAAAAQSWAAMTAFFDRTLR